MSKFAPLIEASRHNKTILGVGPMSVNTIDAAIEIANENKIPLILIASRRQIESKDLGGGYVWDTKSFAEYVRSKDKGGYVFLARDHGGPWQGNNEQDLDYYSALEKACISYYCDIKNGFDILHIDPSLKSRSIEVIIEDVKWLYKECEKYAKDLGKDIIYEAGTEEHSGKINSLDLFEKFVNEIKSCEKIKFVVGNTGLWVKEDRNIGTFDEKQTTGLVKICNENGLLLKAHNVDYTAINLPEFGVHSANVAPEFGVIETRAMLTSWMGNGFNSEAAKFVDVAFDSNSWKKWMIGDKEASKEHKAELCGHYVFNYPEIKLMRQEINKLSGFEAVCKSIVKSVILGYLYDFGWSV